MAQIMHLTQQDKGLQADLLARPIATNIPGHWYMAEDTERYYYAGSDGTLIPFAFASEIQADYIQSVANTPGIGLAVDANGELTATAVVSADTDNVLEVVADGFKVKDIAIEAGSQPFLNYNAATREISVTQLLVSDVTVNNSEADLVAFIAANYTAGDEFQSGDVIILQQENKAYIHNGGTAGTDADFSPIEVPGTSDAQIRALFTGDDVVSYNPATGVFAFVLDPASDSSASVSAAGLKIDVSAGEVTDTNDILGGGVVDISLQTLLDGLASTAKSAIQSYTVSGDAGTTTFDKGDNVAYTGGTLLATTVSEAGGVVTVKSDIDTTGGTAGQIIKLVDDGSGNLVPTWTVDSASGFQQYSIPFAAADGTLTEENDLFRYNDVENKLQINFPAADRALNDWRNQGNFVMQYDGADNGNGQPENITTFGMSGGGGQLNLAYQDVGTVTPRMTLMSRQKNSDGTWKEFDLGQSVGALQFEPTVNKSYKSNANGQRNSRYEALQGIVTEVSGTHATNDHYVSLGFSLNAHNKDDQFFENRQVLSGNHLQEVTLHGYENGGVANFLGTDATGKIITHTNYLPATIGTENQILKVDNAGNLVWAEDTAGAFNGAENGVNFNATTGNVELGGALIKNTDIELAGFAYSLTDSNADVFFGVNATGLDARTSAFEFHMGTSGNGVKFKDLRAGAAQVGIVYDADYSANFVANSLITKQAAESIANAAVAAADFTQYTIENGLTLVNDDTIKLGGALTGATAIDLGANNFDINAGAGKFQANTDLYFNSNANGIVLTSPNGTQYRIKITDFGAISAETLV
jgi:hypothetical protein